jgi:hypothetical protein
MPVLHFCFAGSRPAMTMLAVAPPWTTASSINLRRATPVLPIAIGRPSSPPHRPFPKEAVNAPRQHTTSAEIPIAADAPHCPMSRGFLPWRFADAGPRSAWRHHHGPASENLHNCRRSSKVEKPLNTNKLASRQRALESGSTVLGLISKSGFGVRFEFHRDF